jgi:Fe-S-cluster containining protein
VTKDRGDGLEQQVERGALHTHSALGRTSLRAAETESFLYGLLDVLLAKGVVSQEEIATAVQRTRAEMEARGEATEPGAALRLDSPEEAERATAHVDCAARMHVCHAICCKLDFALSAEEVEAGDVKWDLGRPYFIRHEADGRCHHSDRDSGKCGAYEHRPIPCKNYSCAGDHRIWKDFERMELHTEWLDEHLTSASRPRAVHLRLVSSSPSTPKGPKSG